jgi:methylated-DNA-[protein]-cysteine S-methyltransferase
VRWSRLETPIGPLLAAADGDGRLAGLWFDRAPEGRWRRDDAALAPVGDQLAAYFAGDRRDFELPLAPAGTPWQRAVWSALASVPYGSTLSYGELAARLGRPAAARAVGAANARNPVSVVVPCHRLVGASGALTGYGGGTDRKAWLIAHERRVAAGAHAA